MNGSSNTPRISSLPILALLLSSTSLGAAHAGCTTSDATETCSGTVTGAIVHTDGKIQNLSVYGLTSRISALDDSRPEVQNGAAIDLRDPGGITPEPSDWSDSNRNGQTGIDGAAGKAIQASVDLSDGHGIEGNSGIVLYSVGWQGSDGHGADHTDKTARGGAGGAGGAGGDVSFSAYHHSEPKIPSPISVGAADATSFGIVLQTIGGVGGDGGTGHSKGGLKDAYGGDGGTGGDSGNATLLLDTGHRLVYEGGGVGIALVAEGGTGGAGGKAEVDAIDADKATGGTGGTGGGGGTVTATANLVSNTITTTGAYGVVLSSSGGNGGNGGTGKDGHNTGGSGGNAGNGGDVTADLSVDVSASGANGSAVFVSSSGGFAGDTGDSSGGIVSHPGKPGEPGQGGAVNLVLRSSQIVATGDAGDGILVQSVGGKGGNGGAASGFITYGSKGGSGGAGGAVSVTLQDTTTVSTAGDGANALLVQSIGGGGGKSGKASGLVALGASAKAGGFGGQVSVTLTDSTLTTKGVNADAVLIQSIGGGGGNSAATSGLATVGGDAGLGGDGGEVALTARNLAVTATGTSSTGVFLSSVGAGGGNAHSGSGVIVLGGKGGGGGNAGSVKLTSQVADGGDGGINVTTSGDHGDAVLLQSIGGGGGKASGSFDALDLIAPIVGAQGGTGGTGGTVTFTGSGSDNISTAGFAARGFVAQSIGGGGGVGGNTVSVNIGLKFNSGVGSQSGGTGNNGGTVSGSLGGLITTKGDSAAGVLVQSVGGGGGAAGNDVQAGVSIEFNHDMGASGGGGGDGGTVTLNNAAVVTTSGRDADAVLAQSVGGGGGQSSNVVDANVGSNISQLVGKQGASGGAGGNGGQVTVTSSGKLATGGFQSIGILAQSIAGGGGKSGHTVNGDISINLIDLSVGQSGGNGGTSGAVTVTNSGSITTKSELSTAILAQSVAGGGGQAGTLVNGNIGAALDYTHGGKGGTGGTSANVSVTNQATLSTSGDGALGIGAQSMGGGGGNGGLTANGALGIANVTIGVGGDGGAGGQAGSVNVTNTGAITTQGNKSFGVLALSQGGSGGNAGLLAQGTGSGGPVTGTVSVSVGGSGGSAGNGQSATVDNSGSINTSGFAAYGLASQSVGGDGGIGGAVYAGTLTVSTEGAGSVNVTVGGSGGKGGRGGKVSATNHSSITTAGHYADAIFAQSVGGNGGAGGTSYGLSVQTGNPEGLSSTVVVGGSGGSGAVGGDVSVLNSNALKTSGGNAHGIFAQSIGGNGGDGGSGIGFLGDLNKVSGEYVQVKLNSQVGGSGGSGMHAGSVNVSHSGSIATEQDTSYGIFAQSIGGGGGDGGNAGAYTIGYTYVPSGSEKPENKGYNLSVTLGGSGGAAGDGDDVTVSTDKASTIQTQGTASYAVFAQSVGGGGGTGGNGEPGLEGWLANIYDWKEKYSSAMEAYEELKKLYGGEYKALFREGFSVDIGGSGGASGLGGTIAITNDGDLTTTGADATAIFAQSVGGGGGVGGDGSQGLLNSFSMAGDGKASGDGGSVTVASSGTITTTGDRAMGIFAQSIGGGGGVSGDLESSIINDIGTLGLNIGIGLAGSDNDKPDGNGGAITVSVAEGGVISTSGDTAHGIFAQSAGGSGGGAAKYSISDSNFVLEEAKAGSGGGSGNGGLIKVTVDGTVSVSGDNAAGIFAQSLAGKEDSYSDGVSVEVTGKVTAGGQHGRAILVQSQDSGKDYPDPGTGGTSYIEVKSGGVVETTNTLPRETIGFLGGRSVTNSDGSLAHSNLLTNYGTVFSKTYVVATDGKGALRIHNYGSMTGRLRLDGDAQTAVTVFEGGTFNIADSNLGAHSNSLFLNQGTVKPGWTNDIRTVTITSGGSFQQADGGTILFDADLSNPDVNGKLILDVTNVTLDGTVAQNFIANPDLVSGDKGTFSEVVQYTGSGTLKKDGLSAPSGTALAYTLNWSGDNKLSLDYEVDYSGQKSGSTLGRNSTTYGVFFNNAMHAARNRTLSDRSRQAVSDLGRRILNVRNSDELETVYEEHMVDESAVGAVRALQASHSVQDLLRSCPELDPSDPNRFFRQQECSWGKVLGGFVNQDRSERSSAYDEAVAGFAVGAQREISQDVYLEAVGQYEKAWINGSSFSMEGHQVSAGVALKREIGNLELAGTASGGIYTYDHQRTYSTLASSTNTKSDINGRFASVEARIAGVFETFGTYLKPSASVGVTQIWQDDFEEAGGGPLNWKVGDIEHTAVYVRPRLEVGQAFTWAGAPAVAFVRAGITHQFTDPGMSLTTNLVEGSADLGALNLIAGGDRTQLEFEAGLNAEIDERFTFSLLGSTALSNSRQAWGGQVKMSYRF